LESPSLTPNKNQELPMNNLTQNQIDAKEAYLSQQQEQMLELYKNADATERKAIIKQIDSFLPIVTKYEKIFWLKFRQKLERLNESSILFSLGSIYLTIGAQEALDESNQLPNEFLEMHQKGNWGIVCKDDWRENDFSVKNGFRILSAFKTAQGVKLWLITEADRSATTILLPDEY
jgi:hypothetical protein